MYLIYNKLGELKFGVCLDLHLTLNSGILLSNRWLLEFVVGCIWTFMSLLSSCLLFDGYGQSLSIDAVLFVYESKRIDFVSITCTNSFCTVELATLKM